MNLVKPRLRDYQKTLVAETYEHYRQGKKNPLIVLPTGGGKTITSAAVILDAVAKSRKVLFCVHRDSLVGQTVRTLESFGLRVGIVKAGYPRPEAENYQVYVVGIQSFAARYKPIDMAAWDKALIVFDEAHTTRWWASSAQLVEYTRKHVKDLLELGLTATPYRLKKREYLGQFYDCAVKGVTVRQLQEINAANPESGLVKFRYQGWGGYKGFDELRASSSGDYSQADIDKAALNEEFLNESVAKLIEFTEASPRQERVACFCSSHAQVEEIRQRLEAAGKVCAVVLGDTPLDDRDELYGAFAYGDIEFLLGCGCFAEGWDCKQCNAIALFRPTKSKALYVQTCGRAARPMRGKEYALILDFTNTVAKLGYLEDLSEDQVRLDPLPEVSDNTDPQTKQCPECGSTVRQNAPVCPECGHRFTDDESEFVKPTRKPVLRGFGAILPNDRRKTILKLRRKRFELYDSGKDPQELYKGFSPTTEGQAHLYRTIYPGEPTPAQYYDFTEYLLRFCNHELYLSWHLKAEFGTGEWSDELQCEQECYTPPRAYRPWHAWLDLEPSIIDPEEAPKAITQAAAEALRRDESVGSEIAWAISRGLAEFSQ